MDDPSSPTVWVSNFSGHNYSDAERFGPIRFITEGYVSLRYLDRVFDEVVKGSADTHKDDYFLLSGMNLINVLAVLVWYNKHKKIKLLIWDKKEKTYRLFELDEAHLDFTISKREEFDEYIE
jgi:hypothetical protein